MSHWIEAARSGFWSARLNGAPVAEALTAPAAIERARELMAAEAARGMLPPAPHRLTVVWCGPNAYAARMGAA